MDSEKKGSVSEGTLSTTDVPESSSKQLKSMSKQPKTVLKQPGSTNKKKIVVKDASGKSKIKSVQNQSVDECKGSSKPEIDELDEFEYDEDWEHEFEDELPSELETVKKTRWDPARSVGKGRGFTGWVQRTQMAKRGRGGLVTKNVLQNRPMQQKNTLKRPFRNVQNDKVRPQHPRKMKNFQVKLQNGRRVADAEDHDSLVIPDDPIDLPHGRSNHRPLSANRYAKRMSMTEEFVAEEEEGGEWHQDFRNESHFEEYSEGRSSRFDDADDSGSRAQFQDMRDRVEGLRRENPPHGPDDYVDCRELLLRKKSQRASEAEVDLRAKLGRKGSRESSSGFDRSRDFRDPRREEVPNEVRHFQREPESRPSFRSGSSNSGGPRDFRQDNENFERRRSFPNRGRRDDRDHLEDDERLWHERSIEQARSRERTREREFERERERQLERERLEMEREQQLEREREFELERVHERQRKLERERKEREMEIERKEREMEMERKERGSAAEHMRERERIRIQTMQRMTEEKERERQREMDIKERGSMSEQMRERERIRMQTMHGIDEKERERERRQQREMEIERKKRGSAMEQLREKDRIRIQTMQRMAEEKERERERRERERRDPERERERRDSERERDAYRRERERMKEREVVRERSPRAAAARRQDDEWRERENRRERKASPQHGRGERKSRPSAFGRAKPEEWHRERHGADSGRDGNFPPSEQPWKDKAVKDWSSAAGPPQVMADEPVSAKGPSNQRWNRDSGASSTESGFWHRRSAVEQRDFKDRISDPFFGGRDFAAHTNDEPNEVIFILGLAQDVTELEIRQDIRQCDLWPSDVRLLVDSAGKSQGIIVVTFNTKDEAYSWMFFRKGKLTQKNGTQCPMIYKSVSYDWMCVRCDVPNYKSATVCCHCKRPREDCLDGWDEASPYPTNALVLRNVSPKTPQNVVITTLKCYMPTLRIERIQLGPRCLCFVELTSVVDAMSLYTRLIGNILMIDKRQIVVSYARLDRLPATMEIIRNESKTSPFLAAPFLSTFDSSLYTGAQRAPMPVMNTLASANPLEGRPIIDRGSMIMQRRGPGADRGPPSGRGVMIEHGPVLHRRSALHSGGL